MVLLSSAMRAAEFSGNSKPLHRWMAGRQLLPWAAQWTPPRHDPASALASLNQLHASGVIDDREYAELRARTTKA